MPAARNRSSISGANPFRLARSIFRRCPNAALTTLNNVGPCAGKRGSGKAVKWTTAECAFGGGVNASGGSSRTTRASVRHAASTARRPYALLPGTGYLELAAQALEAQGEPLNFEIKNLTFFRPLNTGDGVETSMRLSC